MYLTQTKGFQKESIVYNRLTRKSLLNDAGKRVIMFSWPMWNVGYICFFPTHYQREVVKWLCLVVLAENKMYLCGNNNLYVPTSQTSRP